MLTTSRICIGLLSAALLPAPNFRAAGSSPGGLPDTPAAGQQAAAPGGPITVSNVTIQKGNGGETFVDVSTSAHATYHVLQLKKSQRLVVDFDGAHKGTPRGFYKAESGVLRRVRVAQFRSKSPAVVRVVADLKDDPTFQVLATPSGVRIELKPRALAQAASLQAPGPPHPPVPAPVQRPSPAPPELPSQVLPRPMVGAPVQPVSMPGMQAPSPPFYRTLPFKTLAQNEKLLDSLGLKIVLMYSYRKGGPDEAAWKTKGAPGVEASRLFLKPIAPGSYRTLELAVAASPQGGFDLVVYGQQVEQSSTGSNPDMPAIQQLVNEEVGKIESAPPPSDLLNLNFETYYLSYATADRAMALLKTLGYTTIEYNGQAGEALYQTIYNPIKLGTGKPPIIVKLIDASKTSIMQPATSAPGAPAAAGAPQAMAPQMMQQGGFSGPTYSSVPPLGGTYLDQMTTGEPQERLLILYDKNDPEALQSLMNLLETTVDVPSRQIMIEAQVIEINASKLTQLGVTFETVQKTVDVASNNVDQNGNVLPAIFSFDNTIPAISRMANFKAQLQALLSRNEAQILSSPSVLVLDDRQARIQIGQQVPVSQQVVGFGQTVSSVSYFPVGIVLNLRPRINEDGSEITMQTETIVSALNKLSTQQLVGTAAQAPVVDNRQVQSIVRVADNTPFIIGGLISTDEARVITGIPLLSDIPLLGNLFRSSSVTHSRQEVIIVITPHVVPLEDKYFSYLIPKDSRQFDRFNYQLFRNAYRIRGNDIFDLEFIFDSNVYKDLVKRVGVASAGDHRLQAEEPFASVLKGGAPGEEILVQRMLWEIIDKTDYGRFVNPTHIIFFEDNPMAVGGAGWQFTFLSQKLKNLKHGQNALALSFVARPQGTEERPLVPPKAVVSFPSVTVQSYPEQLINGNDRNPDGTPRDWMILLGKNYSGIRVPPFKLLQEVLVLKRLLELNKDMPLTLKEFHIGRQIVFPSQEEIQQGYQFIDRDVAKLFYEVYNYYPVFEEEFNRNARLINARIGKPH